MVSVTISEAPPVGGTWSAPVVWTASNLSGWGALSIVYGAGAVATMWLQRSIDSGVSYNDVLSWEEDEETGVNDSLPGVLYRIGCKESGWTSGSTVGRLDT